MLHKPTAAAIILLLTLCACSHGSSNRYLISSLTLPPGAVETGYQITGTPGRSGCIVQVQLESADSWETVTRHIDRCLLRAGFPSAIGNDFTGRQKAMTIGYQWQNETGCMVLLTNESEYEQGRP